MPHPREAARRFSPLEEVDLASLTQRVPDATPARRTHTGGCETTLRARIDGADKRSVELLCLRLSDTLHVTVRPSNLLRALLTLAVRVESQLQTEAHLASGGIARPSNGDTAGLVNFEDFLSGLLLRSFARSMSRRGS